MKSDSRPASTRNLQLDFFRGLALIVIFINHMPGNPWADYTPSQLGPSDAAEAFVFLSGFAAAIAFGGIFRQAGIGLGTVKVLLRCGQIYAAHLSLFILMTTLLAFMISLGIADNHWQLDQQQYFFEQPQKALLALACLQYVPNFIKILPMYLVILLWLPMVWVLSRIHVLLAILFSVSLYSASSLLGWELSGDPVGGQPWQFNPFCWQLIFFTGFAFSSGWLPVPRFHHRWMWSCLLFVVFCYPLENPFGYHRLPWFAELRESWSPWLDKPHLGLMRYMHFLALSYLVSHFMRSRQHWLKTGPARKIIGMGRQSLPVFMIGTCLSFIGGMLLESSDAKFFESSYINLSGLGIMMLSAQLLNWFEAKPWKTALKNTGQPAVIDWSQHAVLAFSLLFLTVTPLLFLQSQSTPINMTETSSSDLALTLPEEMPRNTEKAAFQKVEKALESPDTL